MLIKIIPVLDIIRLEENDPFGTLGMMRIQAQLFCATLEPPDLLNKKNVSSIPAQQYICKRYSSEKYPDTFQIICVPDRDKVLFHAGNTTDDTEGCPLLGQYPDKLAHYNRAVLNSGATFKRFMNIMHGHDVLHLTIKEFY